MKEPGAWNTTYIYSLQTALACLHMGPGGTGLLQSSKEKRASGAFQVHKPGVTTAQYTAGTTATLPCAYVGATDCSELAVCFLHTAIACTHSFMI